jgi:hypothetical protein
MITPLDSKNTLNHSSEDFLNCRLRLNRLKTNSLLQDIKLSDKLLNKIYSSSNPIFALTLIILSWFSLSIFSPTPVVSAGSVQAGCDFGTGASPLRTNWTRDCEIPAFDESNGKLQSVVLNLRGKITASMRVKNGDVSGRSGTTTTSGTIVVNTPDGQSLGVKPEISYTDNFDPCVGACGDVVNAIPPSFDTTPNKAQKEYPLTDSLKIEALTITNNLDRYAKVGNVKFTAAAAAQANTNIGGNYALSGISNGSAYLEVTYNYSSKPKASDSTVVNASPNTNVGLSKSLNGTSVDDKIVHYVIKTLPDASVCKLVLKTVNNETPVAVGQVVDFNQLQSLVCKPMEGSAGKSTEFQYVAVDSKNNESNQAVVRVNLLPSQGATIPPVSFGSSLLTRDCNLKFLLEKDKSFGLDKCFEIEGTAAEYKLTNFRTGDGSALQCGYFELNGSKLTEGQKVAANDIKKINFVAMVSSCKACNLGFNFVAIDAQGKSSNVSSVNILPEGCTPEVEETLGKVGLARSGGYFESNREVIVLLTVLFFSIAFFFSSLSAENIKRAFSRK